MIIHGVGRWLFCRERRVDFVIIGPGLRGSCLALSGPSGRFDHRCDPLTYPAKCGETATSTPGAQRVSKGSEYTSATAAKRMSADSATSNMTFRGHSLPSHCRDCAANASFARSNQCCLRLIRFSEDISVSRHRTIPMMRGSTPADAARYVARFLDLPTAPVLCSLTPERWHHHLSCYYFRRHGPACRKTALKRQLFKVESVRGPSSVVKMIGSAFRRGTRVP